MVILGLIPDRNLLTKGRHTMRTRSILFGIALLGVFGTGRLGDGQESSAAQPGLPSAQKKLPPIDEAVSAKTETATFALG
jgi:hypothetical protein